MWLDVLDVLLPVLLNCSFCLSRICRDRTQLSIQNPCYLVFGFCELRLIQQVPPILLC